MIAGDRLSRTERQVLVAILGAALALRVAWILFVDNGPPTSVFSGDEYFYWYYGQEIAAGHGYISAVTGTATAYYPVGFPAILAALYWVTLHTAVPDNLLAVTYGFQVVISVATVWLVFVVGRRLFATVVGLVAAGLFAVWPNVVYQVGGIQVETTFVFLTMAALAIAVDHDWSKGPPSTRRLLAFGAVLAASVYVRPFSIGLVAGVLLALVTTRIGWRRSLLAAGVPLAVVALSAVPWTIRNSVRFDALIVSSTNLGDTLCIDRNLDATGGFRWSDHDGCVDPGLPEAQRYRGNTRKAIEFVVDHPGRELLQIYRRGRLMFINDTDGLQAAETLSGTYVLTSTERTVLSRIANGYFFAMLALTVVGGWSLRRAPRAQRRIFLSGLVSLLVIPLFLWGNPRFHFPVLPFFVILASAGLCWIAGGLEQRLRTRSQPSLAADVPSVVNEPNGIGATNTPTVNRSHRRCSVA